MSSSSIRTTKTGFDQLTNNVNHQNLQYIEENKLYGYDLNELNGLNISHSSISNSLSINDTLKSNIPTPSFYGPSTYIPSTSTYTPTTSTYTPTTSTYTPTTSTSDPSTKFGEFINNANKDKLKQIEADKLNDNHLNKLNELNIYDSSISHKLSLNKSLKSNALIGSNNFEQNKNRNNVKNINDAIIEKLEDPPLKELLNL